MTDFKIGDRVSWKARLSGRTVYGKNVRRSVAGGFYAARHDRTGFEFLLLPADILGIKE